MKELVFEDNSKHFQTFHLNSHSIIQNILWDVGCMSIDKICWKKIESRGTETRDSVADIYHILYTEIHNSI